MAEYFGISLEIWIGVAIAIATIISLIIGICEYRRQNKMNRVEKFVLMRHRFKENEKFKKLRALIEDDSLELLNISLEDKRDFLGFFEEIALMMNSGLIPKNVVSYMFGYYAIKCDDSKNFCKGKDGNIVIQKDKIYWVLFQKFVREMRQEEEKLKNGKEEEILKNLKF